MLKERLANFFRTNPVKYRDRDAETPDGTCTVQDSQIRAAIFVSGMAALSTAAWIHHDGPTSIDQPLSD